MNRVVARWLASTVELPAGTRAPVELQARTGYVNLSANLIGEIELRTIGSRLSEPDRWIAAQLLRIAAPAVVDRALEHAESKSLSPGPIGHATFR